MDSRRSVRVSTRFLAAIDGYDQEPVARRGDISSTGIYFETSHEVGGIGTIHWLRLVSNDYASQVRVMAYVVRRVMVLTASGPPVNGVAFEFMPETDEAATALEDYVRHVHRPLSNSPMRQLSVRSMVLETNWRVEEGERVRIDIAAPGMARRIRLEGRAVRVAPQEDPNRFTIAVEVKEETGAPIRQESILAMKAVRPDSVPPPPGDQDAIAAHMNELLSALIQPTANAKPRRHEHLSGEIARIRLPTLVSLFELERMSGRLVVRRGDQEATLYVKDGRIVDVEPLGGYTARTRVAQILAWTDGAFQLSMEKVERDDRLEVSTTALLLDLARESDESSR